MAHRSELRQALFGTFRPDTLRFRPPRRLRIELSARVRDSQNGDSTSIGGSNRDNRDLDNHAV
jgi:hypothetical protein